MTAHILFPAIDPDNPATLSKAILQDVLRGELGFEGVIISDSMNMKSMVANYSPAESAIRAFDAGIDLLMLAEEHYSHDSATYLHNQVRLLGAVRAAVEQGRLPLARIDDAVKRVLTLKRSHGLWPDTPLAESTVQEVGGATHQAIEVSISRDAVAVLRDRAGHIPVQVDAPITLVNTTVRSNYEKLTATRGIGPNQALPAFDSVVEAFREKLANLTVLTAEDILRGVLPSAGVVIAVTENYPLPGMDFDQSSQWEVIARLHAHRPDQLLILALRDPYELVLLPDVGTYVCAFSFRPCAAQAAVEIICGVAPAVGHSPVSVPGTLVQAMT